MLKPPNWSLSFYIYYGASATVVKSTLYQPFRKKGKEYLITYGSR